MSPAIVHNILGQLQHQNAVQRDAFADVIADYMGALQRSRELQVRFGINVSVKPIAYTAQQDHGQLLPLVKPWQLQPPCCRCAALSLTRRRQSYGRRTRPCCAAPRRPSTAPSSPRRWAGPARDTAALLCLPCPCRPLLTTPSTRAVGPRSTLLWRHGRSSCRTS